MVELTICYPVGIPLHCRGPSVACQAEPASPSSIPGGILTCRDYRVLSFAIGVCNGEVAAPLCPAGPRILLLRIDFGKSWTGDSSVRRRRTERTFHENREVIGLKRAFVDAQERTKALALDEPFSSAEP